MKKGKRSRTDRRETTTQRSAIMARVKNKDTAPEMIVRRLAFALGYRYRLHSAKLAGKPDLVFSGRRKVIFVHGCFWHGHHCRAGQNRPMSNTNYWSKKLERNIQRDKENLRGVRSAGFSALVIWECETRDTVKLKKRLQTFLGKVKYS